MFNPTNRFTGRDCSSHGTDIIPNSSKICSRRDVVTRGHNLIGIGHKVISARLGGPWRHDWTHFDGFHLDVQDFYDSNNFWDNSSSSGVGAWGDPTNDYQIPTGGLKDIMLAYPSPHRIRRNFTPFPYAHPAFNIFQGDPTAPAAPADFMINTTMTKQNVDYLVNSFEGDFIGFQAYTESPAVSSTLLVPAVLTFPNRALIPASISSSVGKRVVLLYSASLTDTLPKGHRWPLCRQYWSPRLLSGTNVVFERTPILHAPRGSCHFSTARFTASSLTHHTMWLGR